MGFSSAASVNKKMITLSFFFQLFVASLFQYSIALAGRYKEHVS